MQVKYVVDTTITPCCDDAASAADSASAGAGAPNDDSIPECTIICEMKEVREYVNGDAVELWRNDKNGRLVIRASNECGNGCTMVDLWDLLAGCQLVLHEGCWKVIKGPENYAIEAILREIECALDAELYYLAIIICLTLPDVCAALESADGRTNETRYKAWYGKNAKLQAGGADPDECYSLRCGMIQGKMQIKKSLAGRILFTTKHGP
jgi:hypothetical protein